MKIEGKSTKYHIRNYKSACLLGFKTSAKWQSDRFLKLGKKYLSYISIFAILVIVTLTFAKTTMGQLSYAPAVNYPTGQYPFFVLTNDFNGDGKQDLVTSNSDGNSISILLGNGNGTFQPPNHFSVGNRPLWLEVRDFNGDGKADIAVTHYFSNDVAVLLGNGNGTFQPPVFYPTGTNAYSVAAGDVNNDGKLDLVVVNYTCYQCNSSFSVLLGNGNGTFQNATNFPTGGNGSQSHALGDLNHDGKLDIVVSSADSNNLSVLLGNGNGTFQTPVNYPTGSNPVVVALGYLNSDNILDLAVTTYFNNQVSVRLGNGNGTFQNEVGYNSGPNPGQALINDFDGNGVADLAAVNITGNAITLLLNNTNTIILNAGASPFSAVTGDFNQDGRLDFAVANRDSNNVSVLLNTTPAPYTIMPLYDMTKAHKLGSTIPIKIQVFSNNNINVSSPSLIVNAAGISVVSNNAPGEDANYSGNSNPDFNFRYASDFNGYIYNLDTSNLTTNTTYKLYFRIGNSPTLYSVTFQIR